MYPEKIFQSIFLSPLLSTICVLFLRWFNDQFHDLGWPLNRVISFSILQKYVRSNVLKLSSHLYSIFLFFGWSLLATFQLLNKYFLLVFGCNSCTLYHVFNKSLIRTNPDNRQMCFLQSLTTGTIQRLKIRRTSFTVCMYCSIGKLIFSVTCNSKMLCNKITIYVNEKGVVTSLGSGKLSLQTTNTLQIPFRVECKSDLIGRSHVCQRYVVIARNNFLRLTLRYFLAGNISVWCENCYIKTATTRQ